ncbi:MAG: NfeD family protein [Betaproteobacteria bacterium]|nr:NfeD family protein [Betaproteobacteria bacterium]MBI3935773.1 NfeD family protein [Betaproteobacteria bacterium]
MEPLWWHWVVLGIVLMLLELALPAFFLIWFGLGAVVVGVVLLIVPGLPFAYQVLAWTAFSTVFVWLWFKVFKPGIHKTRVGLSRGQFIGEIGLVTKDIRPYEMGQIRFQKPILGDDVWDSIADEDIKAGERVKVLAVEGNILKVGRV